MCLTKQHISCERESFTPVLRQIVKEYLHRDVGEGVFIWPWSLLRLAALDPVMVEEVREITQNFIGEWLLVEYGSSCHLRVRVTFRHINLKYCQIQLTTARFKHCFDVMGLVGLLLK